MSFILEHTENFFKKDGILSNILKNFEYRENQHKMAMDIAETFENSGISILEAGTGIGKTFAYLIPAFLNSEKVVIVTKSKNLQEQLYFKDVEILKNLMSFSPKVIYLKGRSNYVCLNKLSKISISNVFFKSNVINDINKWIKKTKFGDISELKEYINEPVLHFITSSSDTCAGSKCAFFDDCFIYKLKIAAEKSDIIIVNYHLLFADLKVKNEGFGKVLPEFRNLICDEAHSIEEIATEYFGNSFSRYQLTNFIRELEVNNVDGLEKVKNAIEEFFLIINKKIKDNLRVDLIKVKDSYIEEKGDTLIRTLKELSNNLKKSNNDELKVLSEKSEKYIYLIDDILFINDNFNVKWIEKTEKNIILKCFPIDVTEDLGNFFYNLKTVIFTSATLSVNNNFDFFKKRIGIEFTFKESIYPSPFNYKKQSLMYIPEKFVEPNSKDFPEFFSKEILKLLKITRGNAFILFTNLKNMRIVGEFLRNHSNYEIFIQGETTNLHMIENFKNNKNSVLLGSYSFWEGIDIPGENLSLVIIEKLPFAVPSDPLKKARINKIREENGNPFFDYQIPEAVMLLKQGIGRLIRSKNDTGIIAIFDIRLRTKNYGKIFIKNLPEMNIFHNIDILKENFKSGVTP